ncbi:hypothetical protein DdX_20128 [Ditylenchus destructor]|uniref:Uncharacterized protein n=1 Tax=Ditylenchus destructor TaxID=166010 RepID=A0AAD4MH60_9BILA|nr:hypothetical protein DdX_20128 [Ditylenchus destructor]
MNRQPVPEGGRDRKRPQLTHNAVSLAGWAGLKKQSSKRKRSAEAWDCRLQTRRTNHQNTGQNSRTIHNGRI